MNDLLRAGVEPLMARLRRKNRAGLFSKAMSLSFLLWVVMGINGVGPAMATEHGILESSSHLNAVQVVVARTDALDAYGACGKK